jgi:hypothetical protein
MLSHYPKAVAGKPEDLNKLKPCPKVPFEIVATVEAKSITLQALRNGKPVPNAVFHAVDSNLTSVKLTGDAEGKVVWKPPQTERYSVYTSFKSKEAGTYGDKEFEEIREFATLAFAWPLAATEGDDKAVVLFEEALAARAQWKGFPGFSARIEGKVDGRGFFGTVTVDAEGTVQVKSEDTVVIPWVKEQLESIAMHRGARAAESGSGKKTRPVLRFADGEDDHPLGRLLVFQGGRFGSSYRVQDKQITVVNRNMGRLNMTITVLDNDKNKEGKFLPRSYTVQYWDAASADLKRTETVQERWTRVGLWDLPVRHTVTSASGAGLSVRSFTLSKHELLKAKGAVGRKVSR